MAFKHVLLWLNKRPRCITLPHPSAVHRTLSSSSIWHLSYLSVMTGVQGPAVRRLTSFTSCSVSLSPATVNADLSIGHCGLTAIAFSMQSLQKVCLQAVVVTGSTSAD